MDTYSIIVLCITGGVLLVGAPLYFAITRQWDRLRAYALELIVRAEATIKGSKKGQERFEWCVTWLYETVIPKPFKFLFPEMLVRKKLQEWFDHLKDYLEDGIV